MYIDPLDSTKVMMDIWDIDRLCPRGVPSNATEEQFLVAPFNDTCLAEFFAMLTAQLRKYAPWEEIVFTCIYAVISILAVIGNGLVIIAVARNRAMRTQRNVLIVNLAISNLVLAITNIPLLWFPSLHFEFPYRSPLQFPNDQFFCKFGNVLPGSNVYCSTCTISVMAIDRYYSVRKLSLATSRGRIVRAVLISIAIWMFSFFLSLPLLIYYDIVMLYVFKNVNVEMNGVIETKSYGLRLCQLNAGPPSANEETSAHARKIQIIITVLQFLFLYVVPLIVLALFNVKLTRFLKMNANQMSKHGAHTRHDNNGSSSNAASTPTNHTPATRGLSLPPIRSERGGKKGLSRGNGSTAAEKASEKRTSRTTALLVAMACSYAVLWLPFTVVSLLIDLDILQGDKVATIIERLDQICKMISMLSICINPFLYGYLNTNFRHEFAEILYCCFRRCTPESKRQAHSQRAFHPEYSSVGVTLRQSSVQTNDESLLSAIRRSFRGSVEKMRNLNADTSAFTRAKSCSVRSANGNETINLTVDHSDLDGDTISAL